MDFRQMLTSLSQLSEATKETGKGRIHTAEPGGYGRKDDEDEEGNKVKADAPKKGRGRPKKDAGEDGEKKSYDTKSLHSAFGGGQKPKKDIGKTSKKHSLKEYIDVVEQSILEGETIEKKGGRVHKGTYGTSYDGDDEKSKQSDVKRGRGRPKKGSDDSGEVKKFDTKKMQDFMVGSKPKTLPGKASVKHKIKEGPMDQLTIQPANQNTQVIKKGTDVIGSVENPQLANQIKTAMTKGEMQLGADEKLNEKAKSVKQQRFMGMVHATQKGEKAPSKEVGKVAKTMKKSDAKDFAKTKHKGLPMKVKEVKDLPGSQEKIDVAEPKGKINAKDFEALRNKKKKVSESMQINEGAIKHLIDDLIADIDTAGPRSAFNVKGHNPERAEKQILAAVQHDDKYNGLNDGEQRSLVKIVLDFFRDEGELEEGIRTPTIPMGNTTTLPFGARPNLTQRPAVMRKAAGQDFPLSTRQVGDRSNDLTDPATTTGLMKDLSKKSPFAFEGKEMKDIQVESWEKQLNSLLVEGITITSSTGQQGTPDSVSINASDADAESLLSVLRNAGIGVFGGEQKPEITYGVASQGEEEHSGTGTEPQMAPTVVGDGDDMLSLIKKMTGIESTPTAGSEESDYEDEESEEGGEDYSDEEDGESEEGEEQSNEGVIGAGVGAGLGAMVGGPMGAAAGGAMGGSLEEEDMEEGNAFSGAVAKAKSDNIPDKGQKFNVGGKEYPVKEEEHSHDDKETTCEGCGMVESSCGCDDEGAKKVDENFANSASDPAQAELMKLKALLSMGNDLNRPKRDQTVGNPTQVSVRESIKESISQWKRLSGIK